MFVPNVIRRQLTLFVPTSVAGPIETLRQRYNPVQFGIIAAHVTLCREDELANWAQVMERLTQLRIAPMSLEFGPPERFADGVGVFLPGIDTVGSFSDLRSQVLGEPSAMIRHHQPHITLMHPRNSRCTTEIFAEITTQPLPHMITFSAITAIAQYTGGVWQRERSFSFR